MLLFYYGTDVGRLQLAITELVHRYRTKHGTACNLHRIDASGSDGYDELDRVLRYPSFFNDATFVTVQGSFSSKDRARAVLKLLKTYGETPNMVVLIRESGTKTECSRAGGALFTYLTGNAAKVHPFDQLSGPKLIAWMQSFCRDRGCTLGTTEANQIISRIGTDSWSHLTELAKLCAWHRSGTISPESISLLVASADQQANVFALTDALAHREKRVVLKELTHQLSGGADPFYLLSMYAFAVRNMLMVGDLTQRQVAPRTIAKTTGLHPFVVSKTTAACRAFELPELRRAHAWLTDADRASKTGAWDATDALYDFVLSVV